MCINGFTIQNISTNFLLYFEQIQFRKRKMRNISFHLVWNIWLQNIYLKWFGIQATKTKQIYAIVLTIFSFIHSFKTTEWYLYFFVVVVVVVASFDFVGEIVLHSFLFANSEIWSIELGQNTLLNYQKYFYF